MRKAALFVSSLFIVMVSGLAYAADSTLGQEQRTALNERIAICRYNTMLPWSKDPATQDAWARRLQPGTPLKLCGTEEHVLQSGENPWALIEARVREEMGFPPAEPPAPPPEPVVAAAPPPPEPVVEAAPPPAPPPPPPPPPEEPADTGLIIIIAALVALAGGLYFLIGKKKKA